jgi:hypothetical protein
MLQVMHGWLTWKNIQKLLNQTTSKDYQIFEGASDLKGWCVLQVKQ